MLLQLYKRGRVWLVPVVLLAAPAQQQALAARDETTVQLGRDRRRPAWHRPEELIAALVVGRSSPYAGITCERALKQQHITRQLLSRVARPSSDFATHVAHNLDELVHALWLLPAPDPMGFIFRSQIRSARQVLRARIRSATEQIGAWYAGPAAGQRAAGDSAAVADADALIESLRLTLRLARGAITAAGPSAQQRTASRLNGLFAVWLAEVDADNAIDLAEQWLRRIDDPSTEMADALAQLKSVQRMLSDQGSSPKVAGGMRSAHSALTRLTEQRHGSSKPACRAIEGMHDAVAAAYAVVDEHRARHTVVARFTPTTAVELQLLDRAKEAWCEQRDPQPPLLVMPVEPSSGGGQEAQDDSQTYAAETPEASRARGQEAQDDGRAAAAQSPEASPKERLAQARAALDGLYAAMEAGGPLKLVPWQQKLDALLDGVPNQFAFDREVLRGESEAAVREAGWHLEQRTTAAAVRRRERGNARKRPEHASSKKSIGK